MTKLAGSYWQRWEPHVHLPGTALNDQYEIDLAEALTRLDGCWPPIEAVGVTDYCSTTMFKQASQFAATQTYVNLRTFFPNVELRLDVQTNSQQYVNIHLVCAGSEVDELDRILKALTFRSEGRDYRLEDEDLIALGRAVTGEKTRDSVAAMRSGIAGFRVSFDQLRSVVEDDSWARQRCLVGVSGGADGTSGLQSKDNSSLPRRREIERLADFILASSPKQEEFWRGDGVADLEVLVRHYGGPKPCLHGSDAHSEATLGKPPEDRYTWIKGDGTFESLLQATLSPTRCHVGRVAPDSLRVGDYLSRLEVDAPWFPDRHLDINPGLVAIVGPKGSGKTALADLLAVSAGLSPDDESSRSFLHRAADHLSECTAAMNWSGGETVTPVALGLTISSGDVDSPPVRYLSQQFVEDLCSNEDGMSDALFGEIQRVVFGARSPTDRLGAGGFDELLDALLGPSRTAQKAEQDQIADLSSQIDAAQQNIDALDDRKAALEREGHTVVQLAAEIAELTQSADTATADRLALVSQILSDREAQAQLLARQLLALEELLAALARSRTESFPNWLTKFRRTHEEAGLREDEWDQISVRLHGEPELLVGNRIDEVGRTLATIRGADSNDGSEVDIGSRNEAQLQRTPIAHLQVEQQRLSELLNLEKRKATHLAKLQERRRAALTRVAQLEADVTKSEDARVAFPFLKDQRDDHYEAYFDTLMDEESELAALYEPLSQVLAQGEGGLAKIRFSVSRIVDLAGWAEQGGRFLDFRYSGAFQNVDEIIESASGELLAAWTSGSGRDARIALRSWIDNHAKAMLRQARTDHQDRAAIRSWLSDVSRWMFSANHVSLTYRIEYDGIDIRYHSPGTRGIVLLLLFLAIDQSETCPLIIDQPEENLDPESVFSELVDLFHDVRERRQVIIVTHNPNLVVNTDVDQVIIARAETREPGALPAMTYWSGGLEKVEVREAVCRILEGGKQAFVERAKRLRFNPAEFNTRDLEQT